MCHEPVLNLLQDNFRKIVEVRKKLIGDTGDTLITPYRVSVPSPLTLDP